MEKAIRWKLHTATSPGQIFALWNSDEGREQFWAEKSLGDGSSFRLSFPDGSEQHCHVVRTKPPELLEFTYFG